MKKAILFGASGFVGSYLLNDLLADPDYDRVTAVVRKPLGLSHKKLNTILADFQTLTDFKEKLIGDEVFIALGTTQKQTPRRQDYIQIDHDYPVLAARLAQENGAKSVFIVTAIGADPKSIFFYPKTKGKTEQDILALNYQHTHIFQPSMITGNRKEKRTLEPTLIDLWTAINPVLLGPLDRFKGIDGKDIATAMIQAAKSQTEKLRVYRWAEMKALL